MKRYALDDTSPIGAHYVEMEMVRCNLGDYCKFKDVKKLQEERDLLLKSITATCARLLIDHGEWAKTIFPEAFEPIKQIKENEH